ncbi:MAG: lipase family protein [Candidatus Cloacimonetes bacterium]|nr:lipase family protein [Candidatus Cloacimonadota bacterium]
MLKLLFILAPFFFQTLFANTNLTPQERFSQLYEIEHPERTSRQNITRLIKYAKMCQTAYSSDSTIQNIYPKSLIFKSKDTEVKVFVTTNDENKTHTVAIRGSINYKNWVANVKFFKEKDRWARGVDVHIGFHNAAREVFLLVRRHLHKDYKITVTGHSLGGATALLVGLYLEYFKFKDVSAITFGQPRITNEEGAKRLNSFSLERIVNKDDLVTKLPPKLFNYRHFGSLFTLSGYKYATEPFVENSRADSKTTMRTWDQLEAGTLDISDDIKSHDINNYLKQLYNLNSY